MQANQVVDQNCFNSNDEQIEFVIDEKCVTSRQDQIKQGASIDEETPENWRHSSMTSSMLMPKLHIVPLKYSLSHSADLEGGKQNSIEKFQLKNSQDPDKNFTRKKDENLTQNVPKNQKAKIIQQSKSFEINNSGTETSRSTNSTMSENLKKTMQEKTQYTQKQIKLNEFIEMRKMVYILAICVSCFTIWCKARGKFIIPWEFLTSASVIYFILALMVWKFGDIEQKQQELQKWVPAFQMLLFLPFLGLTDHKVFESEGSFVFCITLQYALMSFFAVLCDFQLIVQLLMTGLLLATIMLTTVLRLAPNSAYCLDIIPCFVFIYVTTNFLGFKVLRLRNFILQELEDRIIDTHKNQKDILDSMKQGVIIIYENEQKLENQEIREEDQKNLDDQDLKFQLEDSQQYQLEAKNFGKKGFESQKSFFQQIASKIQNITLETSGTNITLNQSSMILRTIGRHQLLHLNEMMRKILLEVIKSNIYYFTLLKKQMKKANIPESKIDELQFTESPQLFKFLKIKIFMEKSQKNNQSQDDNSFLERIYSRNQHDFLRDFYQNFTQKHLKFLNYIQEIQLQNEQNDQFQNEGGRLEPIIQYSLKKNALIDSVQDQDEENFFKDIYRCSIVDIIQKGNDFIDKTFEVLIQKEDKKIDIELRFDRRYFAMQTFSMNFQDLDCKMVQLFEVTKNVLYERALNDKEFASMLNATVSHEMRGPINSIQSGVGASEKEIQEAKQQINEITSLIKQLIEAITSREQYDVEKMKSQHEQNNKKLKFIKKLIKSVEEKLGSLKYIQENVMTGSKLLGFFVQDLLDLAQLRAGTIKKNLTFSDVNQVLKEIIRTQEIVAKAKRVQLIFNPILDENGESVQLEIDFKRMQQVTLNLLTNALKFVPSDGGKVTVGGRLFSKNTINLSKSQENQQKNFLKQYIEISVEDNGRGIREEDKKKLFKMFGKLDRTENQNKQGIGLGLNICKQICNLMHGDINVDSTENEGSRFYFYFFVKDIFDLECSDNKRIQNIIEEDNNVLKQSDIDFEFGDLPVSGREAHMGLSQDQFTQLRKNLMDILKPKLFQDQKFPDQNYHSNQPCNLDRQQYYLIQQQPTFNQNIQNIQIQESESNSSEISILTRYRSQMVNINQNSAHINQINNFGKESRNLFANIGDNSYELNFTSDNESNYILQKQRDQSQFKNCIKSGPSQQSPETSKKRKLNKAGLSRSRSVLKTFSGAQGLITSQNQSMEIERMLSEQSKRQDSAPRQPAEILIVDDQVYNLIALVYQLQGFSDLQIKKESIDQALGGQEALNLLEKRLNLCVESNWLIKPYRVIIVDLNMPEMDGFETVRRIRAMLNVHKVEINRKRSLSNIYFAADQRGNVNTNRETFEREYLLKPLIIINSGQTDEKTIQDCLNAGADVFMEKPTSIKELHMAVHPYLSK